MVAPTLTASSATMATSTGSPATPGGGILAGATVEATAFYNSPYFWIITISVLLFLWAALEMYCKKCDRDNLRGAWLLGQDILREFRMVQTRAGHKIAVRFTEPRRVQSATEMNSGCPAAKAAAGAGGDDGNAPATTNEPYQAHHKCPIVIPNGLAATMLLTGNSHDRLVAAGFTVLSFDRRGVGYSERCRDGSFTPQTVDECVEELLDAMGSVIPYPGTKWIVLGPSMGSIVGQCFMAKYPDLVAGFMNLDGFPHPFTQHREGFLGYAKYYAFFSWLAWLGILRLPLLCASRYLSMFSSSIATTSEIRSMFNSASFYQSTRYEFRLMMDCAQTATEAWGAVAVTELPETLRGALIRMKPDQYGSFDGATNTFTSLPRAVSERGKDWDSVETTAAAREEIFRVVAAAGTAIPPLPRLFGRIPVRVMSARSYDYPGGKQYVDSMRDAAAAEHSLHVVMSYPRGKRYAFPLHGHNTLFQQLDCMVRCVEEVQQEYTRMVTS